MQRVYRPLRIAREQGTIPWEWIVDETRQIEQKRSTWVDPAAYVRAVSRSYKRDFWAQQPRRVVVASEKGTVRGVLDPVLYELVVGNDAGAIGVGLRRGTGIRSRVELKDVSGKSRNAGEH